MEGLLIRYPAVLLAMLILSMAEWLWARRQPQGYDARASFASLEVAIGQALIKPLTGGLIYYVFTFAHGYALLDLSIHDWRVWVLGFFVVEFAYYWFHRWSHMINWLWATHAVHHSANELTLPAAIRLGWTGVISGGWLVFVGVALIGFPPLMIGALLSINLIYQFALHTEAIRRLGPLEWLLNTPSHHRAHHSSDQTWLDCNFGGVLIIFDRLFGSFVAEPSNGGLSYGLTVPIDSYNPFVITLQQWQRMAVAFVRATTTAQRLAVLFGRPDQIDGIDHAPASGRNVVNAAPSA